MCALQFQQEETSGSSYLPGHLKPRHRDQCLGETPWLCYRGKVTEPAELHCLLGCEGLSLSAGDAAGGRVLRTWGASAALLGAVVIRAEPLGSTGHGTQVLKDRGTEVRMSRGRQKPGYNGYQQLA